MNYATATAKNSTSSYITDVLNSTIQAIENIFSFDVSIQKPKIVMSPIQNCEMGVIIGVAGDLHGQIILQGASSLFSTVGEKMYGIALEGEFLHSFTGELGNMVGGHLCTSISKKGISLDITPPTVCCGEFKIYGMKTGIELGIQIESEELRLIFSIND